MTRVLRFDGNALVAAHDPLAQGESPELADSFLYRDGYVRARNHHLNRFRNDLMHHDMRLAERLDAFVAACAAELTHEHEAFPRFDVVSGELWLRVRPAPEHSSSVTAVTVPNVFHNASRKGPNIAEYAALNAAHQAEVIRLDAEGFVLEGVTSALLLWQGNELFAAVEDDRVTSTTEQFVRETASRQGIRINTARVRPQDLERLEVWAVNALHGIRRVTAINGTDAPTGDEQRLASFRADFEASWLPLAHGDSEPL